VQACNTSGFVLTAARWPTTTNLTGTPCAAFCAQRRRARWPALELLTGAKPVLDLRRGEADLAIRSGPVDDEELIVRPLGDSGWSLYAAPAYLAQHTAPIDLDALMSGHALIGVDRALAAVPAARWIEPGGGDGRATIDRRRWLCRPGTAQDRLPG